MMAIERSIFGHFRELVDRTREHPEWSNRRIIWSLRSRSPEGDVDAARIYLGGPFPETASHSQRIRLFYCLAWMHGLQAHPEYSANRGRCDVLVCDRSDTPLMVIEVKSNATAPAANQVAEYRETWPGTLAVVTASSFPASLQRRAAELDVLLLTGRAVADMIGDLAVGRAA